jgi:NAD(P)H-dependent FMN reductase
MNTQDLAPDVTSNRLPSIALLGSVDWESCAHQLASALQGAAKRHQITLAELLCEDAPTFDPPAPTRLDNIEAIGAALATYRSLSAHKAHADTAASEEYLNEGPR